ncbi:hypothetical protein T05_10440 [Trichinella murrelli]|uniref:Uncharacterized protein n=1 Tax=Trichinella murrelli TaxID=144512 RepID=A0A0V0UBS8_9BILA|nr:hypothetical protein T05_10440 [Trichinella murrelli]
MRNHPSTFADLIIREFQNRQKEKLLDSSVYVSWGSARSVQVKEKEALRTGGWFKAAPVPQFQTLVSDWSTSSDMSGNAEFPLS